MTLLPDDIELFHNPDRRMNVLVLSSGTGTNFEKAYEGSQEPDANYSIVYLLTDKERKKGAAEPIGAIQRAQRLGVPYKSLPGMKTCGSYAEAQHGFDVSDRENYYVWNMGTSIALIAPANSESKMREIAERHGTQLQVLGH